jgi:hypothetical protein
MSYGQGYSYNQQQYSQQSSYTNQGPQVPPPWISEWDGPANCWIFINRDTGERTYNNPLQYAQRGYGGGGYGGPQQYGGEYNQEQPRPNHSSRNIALGAVAGLAGGALLMHEGEKAKEHWDEDKYRAEQKFDDGINDVEDAPEMAAQWMGRKVQDVDDVADDAEDWKDREEYRVERKWDDGVQDVEDAPENVARWFGRKVQDVEDIPQDIEGRVDRFDDRIEGSYEYGREQARYDDNW